MRLLAATLSAAALGFATTANAQHSTAAASAMTADGRCLLGMVVLSNSTDANAKRLGQGGVIYFTGRISARDPNFDFARLKTLAATMHPQSVQADLQQHCGPMFKRSMERLQAAFAAPAAPPAPAAPVAPPASPAPAAK